jgi:hypothetical protein
VPCPLVAGIERCNRCPATEGRARRCLPAGKSVIPSRALRSG